MCICKFWATKGYLVYLGSLKLVIYLRIYSDVIIIIIIIIIIMQTNFEIIFATNKGKAIPLQAWTGHKHSRRLRLPYF
jgi:hypothetical protein